MNGIESDESFVLPREREKRQKVLLNIKVFSGLLLSNVLTLLLCLPGAEGDAVEETVPHKGFQLVELPLNNFTRPSGTSRATLFKGKTIVIHDVAIHHHLSRGGSPSLYLVEVAEKDLPKLIQHKGLTLSAFPYGDYPFKKGAPKKRYSYEIRF